MFWASQCNKRIEKERKSGDVRYVACAQRVISGRSIVVGILNLGVNADPFGRPDPQPWRSQTPSHNSSNTVHHLRGPARVSRCLGKEVSWTNVGYTALLLSSTVFNGQMKQ